MIVQALVRDCLYLNWALPTASLAAPPRPLRYQSHSWEGESYTFASALLFHHVGVHLEGLPRLRVSYPQCNVRLYVLDGEGVPSVLFRRMLLPGWIAPAARLLSRQPMASARLELPHPSRDPGEESWSWLVRRGAALQVTAAPAAPGVPVGPGLGSWEDTVRYFQERPRGYSATADGSPLRLEGAHSAAAAVWPLRAEVRSDELVRRIVLGAAGSGESLWPRLHSAWLCPEVPFVFELGLVPPAAAQRAPFPSLPQAAGRQTVAPPRWSPSAN